MTKPLKAASAPYWPSEAKEALWRAGEFWLGEWDGVRYGPHGLEKPGKVEFEAISVKKMEIWLCCAGIVERACANFRAVPGVSRRDLRRWVMGVYGGGSEDLMPPFGVRKAFMASMEVCVGVLIEEGRG